MNDALELYKTDIDLKWVTVKMYVLSIIFRILQSLPRNGFLAA